MGRGPKVAASGLLYEVLLRTEATRMRRISQKEKEGPDNLV